MSLVIPWHLRTQFSGTESPLRHAILILGNSLTRLATAPQTLSSGRQDGRIEPDYRRTTQDVSKKKKYDAPVQMLVATPKRDF